MTQNLTRASLPGLYQSADTCAADSQLRYYISLKSYLFLLIGAAFVAYFCPQSVIGAYLSASLFLITLGILIFLKILRPEDTWYNGRAVAESVKTRAWRWVMRADPYEDDIEEVVSKKFIADLKSILEQNKGLSGSLTVAEGVRESITEDMRSIRGCALADRLSVYLKGRVEEQARWYAGKVIYNRRRTRQWFWVSVGLHGFAIGMLLYRIKAPLVSLPIEVVAVAAGAVLTWMQAKKHNELNSSYALAAHEITLIKGEGLSVKTERELSEFVINSEAAFSREHTQWTARKADR